MLHRQSKTKGLVLPTNYELISEDEAREISGGNPVLAAIGLLVTLQGASYATGRAIAERVFNSGYTNQQYQRDKWMIRPAFMAAGQYGSAMLLGFENRFYELAS